MQTALTQKCCEALKNSLKSDKANGLPDLAEYIVSSTVRRPLPEVLKTIINDSISPKNLLDAVIKSQWLVLEHKLPEIMQLPPADQTLRLKETIDRFNHISEAVLEFREQQLLEEIEEKNKAIAAEREARVMTTVVQQWQKAGEIKFLNYYKGLPVNSTVNIIEKTEERHPSITVQSSDDLRKVLAISPDAEKNRSALTPASDDLFLINMDVIETTRENVTFRANNLMPVEKRYHLRLQPLKDISIQLFRNKISAGTGRIIDLSTGGLSISMPVPEKQAFQKDEIVSFTFRLGNDDLKGSGWIRAIFKRQEHLHFGLEVMPNAGLQRRLQQEISSIQRTLIQEVRKKFLAFS